MRGQVIEYHPAPPATLEFSQLKASIEALGGASAKKRKPPPSSTKGTKSKGAAAAKGSVGGSSSGGGGSSSSHVVRIVLLEEMGGQSVSTPAAPLTFGFFGPQLGSLAWADARPLVQLPRGSPRPPLLRFELWDSTALAVEEAARVNRAATDDEGAPPATPQASLDVRMREETEGDGMMTMLLVGALGFNKDVKLSFHLSYKS